MQHPNSNSFLAHKNENMNSEEILKNWIEDTYGSPEKLAQVLDFGIEMLFYLEENTFEKREVRDVVSAMRGIVHLLRL